MYIYSAYGLIISSQLQLNGLIEANGATPDVIVTFGDVPLNLTNPLVKTLSQHINPDEFLLEVKDIAKFYVRDGKTIIIQKANNGHDGDIQVFLMGTVFAFILQYHDCLVLHGSAILVDGHAAIFSGDSGAGKSTLAAAFAKKGYPVLTDDMVAIKYTSDNKLELIPGWPRLKLWQDALNQLQEKSAGLIRVQNKLDKYEFPIDHISVQPVPIKFFYELNPDNASVIILEKITDKLQCLNLLVKNTFRYHMLKGIAKNTLHLKQCAALAKEIQVTVIKRPKIGYKLNELVKQIETNISEYV